MPAIPDLAPPVMDPPPRRDSSSRRVSLRRLRSALRALFSVALSSGGGRSPVDSCEVMSISLSGYPFSSLVLLPRLAFLFFFWTQLGLVALARFSFFCSFCHVFVTSRFHRIYACGRSRWSVLRTLPGESWTATIQHYPAACTAGNARSVEREQSGICRRSKHHESICGGDRHCPAR